MTMSATEIVRTRIGVNTYLAPTGPLDEEAACPLLRQVVEACLTARESNLVLDLSRVPTLTGAALETLLDIQDRCSRLGGALKVIKPNALVRDIFTVTDFGDYVAILEK